MDQPLNLNSLHEVLDDIQVEDSSQDQALLGPHRGIHAVVSKGVSSYEDRPCAVCGNKGHAFKDCPMSQGAPQVATAHGKLKASLDNICKHSSVIDDSLPHGPNSDCTVNSICTGPIPSTGTLDSNTNLSAITTPSALHEPNVSNTPAASLGALSKATEDTDVMLMALAPVDVVPIVRVLL